MENNNEPVSTVSSSASTALSLLLREDPLLMEHQLTSSGSAAGSSDNSSSERKHWQKWTVNYCWLKVWPIVSVVKNKKMLQVHSCNFMVPLSTTIPLRLV